MELADAAAHFDNQPVTDAYTSGFLFNGQPDLYDASRRDAEAGWRRTISSAAVVVPPRGCIKLDGDAYIMGRTVKDFFRGAIVREYALLHPADGLLAYGMPNTFLVGAGTTAFYAGVSWVKERKEELRSSEVFSIYDVYCSDVESVVPGMLVLDHNGNYLRVHGYDIRSGGLAVLITYDLGASALRQVSYTAAGDYDVVSDSSGAGAPILIDGIVETYASNYDYQNNAATMFERSDKVITVLQADVADPDPGDVIVDLGVDFRVLERLDDGSSCWQLHVRPV